MNHDHAWSRTDEVTTAAGGGLCIQLVEEDQELYVDAEVCACGAVELVLHDDAAPLQAFEPSCTCPRCSAPCVAVSIVSQGGAEIHAPLDRTWTFGLGTRVCASGHVAIAAVGGERVDGAPSNVTLLAQHPHAAPCICGGDRHVVEVESHHSGGVFVGEHALCAVICARCEQVTLQVSS